MPQVATGNYQDGKLTICVQTDRLDAAMAIDFKSDCEKLWQTPVQELVIDMQKVQFIDSSGVGALLSLHKRLPPEDANVCLARVQPAVYSVFELLRLQRIFEIQKA